MVTSEAPNKPRCHVAAIPGPGRGHINPLLNFCKLLTASHDIHVSFILTEEWLALLGSEPAISFLTIPSEPGKSAGVDGLFEAVQKHFEEPVERLLDRLEPPPDAIIADSFLAWAVELGKRREIPVASFWPASANLFTAFYHHQLIVGSHFYPIQGTSAEERIDFIPGIPSIRLADLPGEFQANDNQALISNLAKFAYAASNAQCIIFRTVNELELPALTALRNVVSAPIYPVGPAIPCFSAPQMTPPDTPDYIKWLDAQKQSSVLYISFGTFLSPSDAQIDELATGLRDSRIPFLWVSPVDRLVAILGDKLGKVVSWCDQMRVLSHSSVGGFLTHCGWNSAVEAAFAGVPALTFPLGIDQTLNSKIMVEDWGIGWRVNNRLQELVEKEQILKLLTKLMDLEGEERKELDSKCKKFKELLMMAVGEDGSTSGLGEFLSWLSNCPSAEAEKQLYRKT